VFVLGVVDAIGCVLNGWLPFDAGLTVLGIMVDFCPDTIFWKWRTSWLPVNFVILVLSLKKSSVTTLIQKSFYVTPTAIAISPPVHGTYLPSLMELMQYLMTFFLIFQRVQSVLQEYDFEVAVQRPIRLSGLHDGLEVGLVMVLLSFT
jgi:hypothetical protein